MEEIIKRLRADDRLRKFPQSSNDFGRAVCAYFNLDPSAVELGVPMHTGADEILSLTVTICLDSADLAGIAKQLKQIEEK